MTQSQTSPFGRQLKYWRNQRGFSQLDLAAEAAMSQRHVSFIESGRSRPGEDVVLRVAEALDVPLRERNSLLMAAGLTPRFPELPYAHEDIAPFRAAIERMLQNHEPYPAYVIDRWWMLVDTNAAGRKLFPVPADEPVNVVDVFLSPGPVRDMIENFDEVAAIFLQRLRHEIAGCGSDERLQALLSRAEGYLSDLPADTLAAGDDPSALVICPRLRIGDARVDTFSMVARFGNTRVINLDELRVELIYPADEAGERVFRDLSDSPG